MYQNEDSYTEMKETYILLVYTQKLKLKLKCVVIIIARFWFVLERERNVIF